jgi:hypothetical protein
LSTLLAKTGAMYSKFHTQSNIQPLRCAIVLDISYSFERTAPPKRHCARNFILIRSPGPSDASLYSKFHTHSIAWPSRRAIVLEISYSFDHLDLHTRHCTRNFILIRSLGPPDAPLYSKFHTHSITWTSRCAIVLEISYSFDHLDLQTIHCTRNFILIRTHSPSDAPLYSKFHTQSINWTSRRIIVLEISYSCMSVDISAFRLLINRPFNPRII